MTTHDADPGTGGPSTSAASNVHAPLAPVDPGPPPDTLVAPLDARTRRHDEGWMATVAQGLAIARWAAGEIAARRIEHFAFVAWIAGGIGLACLGLSIPVDPGWVLISLGIVSVMFAVAIGLTIALAAAVMRRLALPRRARHLRPEVAAARARLLDAVTDAGVPVTLWGAVRFVFALAAGRRPHRGVPGNLLELSRRLSDVVEVDRLRQALRATVPGAARRRPTAPAGSVVAPPPPPPPGPSAPAPGA